MCGIAGHWSTRSLLSAGELKSNLINMCASIQHRGPDEQGIYQDDSYGIALGHQRLKVVDLETGQQPMTNPAQDIWLVFNGEIYNYRVLRKELILRGYNFKSNSDTETIIFAYQEWGEDCVQHFQGMFAFVIWDQTRQKIFCARDRLGVKPFYYFWNNNDFVFCSEIKGIVANKAVQKKINFGELSNFLKFSYSPGSMTIFDDIHKLPAGHTLTVKGGRCFLNRYWSIQTVRRDVAHSNIDDAGNELRQKLQSAVDATLVSDVPLGAFLSGGADSSTIVSLMSKSMDAPVLTHCAGFSNKAVDEREYAAFVSKSLKTDHTESLIDIDVGEQLDKIIWHMDEPFADASAIPTYYICQEARKRVTVCLSGDGGDELFAGYNWYAEIDRLSRVDRIIPEWFRKRFFPPFSRIAPPHMRGATLLNNLGVNTAKRHENLITCYSQTQIEKLLVDDIPLMASAQNNFFETRYNEMPGGWDSVALARAIDLQTYMVEDILMKVDKMSMAHSLEVRVPFLDYNVVEFAFQQPSSFMLSGASRKLLLERAMPEVKAMGVFDRSKQGFTVPLKTWLLQDLKERFGDLLLSSNTSHSGIFKTREVEKLWLRLQQGGPQIDLSQHLWTLLCFEMWHQQYV